MDQTGVQLLKLMFNPGETICVSPSQYGYHSIPLEEAFKEEVTLVPTEDSCAKRNIAWGPDQFEQVPTDLLTLVALNPIKGFRLDSNCYAYRNFLLELDVGELKAQVDYIHRIGIPYSAMIFSGGKSVHTLISLDQDVPSEKVYRVMAQWLLNIATLADQNTKNPSRSIRIPGGLRDGVTRQRLIKMVGKVKGGDLITFLKDHEAARPKPREKRTPSGTPDSKLLPPWIMEQLKNGIDFTQGRNRTWFAIACGFALAGYSEDQTRDILDAHFQEERDFREKEWLRSIKSAFDYIHKS